MITDILFQATPFNSQTGKLFGGSQWQIHTSPDFEEPLIYDSNAGSVLSQDNEIHLVPFTEFENEIQNGQYFWRMRYQTTEGVWSTWSFPTEFEITGVVE